MKAKALTRNITHKQARSYQRTTPNGIGVTAIAAVNGRGAFARRNGAPGAAPSANRGGLPLVRLPKPGSKATPNRGAHDRASYAAAYQKTKEILGGKNMRRRKFRRNQHAGATVAGTGTAGPMIGMPIRQIGGPTVAKPAKPKRKKKTATTKRVSATRTAPKRKAARRTKKSAVKRAKPSRKPAAKKTAKPAKKVAKRAKGRTKKLGRKYGKFQSAVVRVGKKKFPSYWYEKKGKVRKIPMYALVGAKSKTQLNKENEKFRGKILKIVEQRRKAADRVRTSGGIFTPNAARPSSVITFKEWSKMRPNRKKVSGGAKFRRAHKRHVQHALSEVAAYVGNKKKKTRSTKRKRARAHHGVTQAAARSAVKSLRKYTKNKKRRAKKAKRSYMANKKRKHTKKSPKRHTKRSTRKAAKRKHAKRSRKAKRSKKQIAAAKRNLRKARAAKKSKGKGKKKTRHAKRSTRKAAKRSSWRRGPRGGYRGPRRRHSRSYSMNRRRHHRRYAANEGATPNRRHKRRKHYAANKKHRRARRHYRRNFSASAFMSQMVGALKVGAIVAVGFVGHRALSKVVSENLLAKWAPFQSGAGLQWRGVVSGLAVAMAAIPVIAKVGGRQSGALTGGVFASLVANAIVVALNQAGQGNVAGYLSGLGEAGGRPGSPLPNFLRGYGEYVPMNGYGEYVPMNGFGAYQLDQAAAGYGALPISQAAAGLGLPISQAAAGYGATIEQAAAGVGEYVAQGIQGIGDYEMTPMTGTLGGAFATYDGIRPDLNSAERALSVAESTAGYNGLGDLPTQSIVDPIQVAAPIGDGTDGTRAGILAGRDGIFG